MDLTSARPRGATASSGQLPAAEVKRGGHIPGEAGIWLFILGDMLAFGLFFAVFMYYRAQSPEAFSESSSTLSVPVATVNTIVLLTASFLVAAAIEAVRRGTVTIAPRLIGGAFVAGLVFVVLKVSEYVDKLRGGVSPETDEFFMFYYMLTGIHLVHVLIGLVLLVFMVRTLRKSTLDRLDVRMLENGATYWHMVDLLWIVLFPLLYLMG